MKAKGRAFAFDDVKAVISVLQYNRDRLRVKAKVCVYAYNTSERLYKGCINKDFIFRELDTGAGESTRMENMHSECILTAIRRV